jgi:hypothetical protein
MKNKINLVILIIIIFTFTAGCSFFKSTNTEDTSATPVTNQSQDKENQDKAVKKEENNTNSNNDKSTTGPTKKTGQEQTQSEKITPNYNERDKQFMSGTEEIRNFQIGKHNDKIGQLKD